MLVPNVPQDGPEEAEEDKKGAKRQLQGPLRGHRGKLGGRREPRETLWGAPGATKAIFRLQKGTLPNDTGAPFPP